MNVPHLSDRLADIRPEFAELGITPTPLAVIAHAFDAGLDETTVVARRDDPGPPRAQGQPGSEPWQ